MSQSTTIDFTRIFDLIDYQRQKFPQSRSLNSKILGKWQPHTIEDLKSKIDCITNWFLENGFKKGDCIAVIPKMGSPEWMMIDLAAQQAGLVIVPIHPTTSSAETEFILRETNASICIATDQPIYAKVKSVGENLPNLRLVFHLEMDPEGYFSPLSGGSLDSIQQKCIEDRRSTVSENDILAIMYTSGTSGISKGVVLSHRNVVCNVKSILTLFPLQPGDRVLSFLPYSHIFERTNSYAYLALGVQIYFCGNIENLPGDFKSVRPHFCATVPRTLERMYNYLLEQLEQKKGIKRFLISWAMSIGENYKSGRKNGLSYALQLMLVRVLVLNRWRKSLGGDLHYMAVGAAALRPEIGRLFSASGVLTLSGYGMTEASPFISVNRYQPGLNRFGTVGIPLPGIDVKIDSPNENGEGEILVKGPNIMQGYFKRPEMTPEVFTSDGWFRTGDVGKWTERRFLSITDRKKDIFKTSAGKYVAPQPLENHFCTSAFVVQCLILGFNKPYVTAILVPNFNLLKSWCAEQGIHWTSPTFMVHNIKVVRKFKDEVERLNVSLQGFEKIREFILSDEEWTVENKELTTSFKPKRNQLLEKHRSEIEKMYKNG